MSLTAQREKKKKRNEDKDDDRQDLRNVQISQPCGPEISILLRSA